MKGIVFTFDAVFALLLIMAIVPVFLLLSGSTTSDTINQKFSVEAEDAMNTISVVKISQLMNEPVIFDLNLSRKITQDDLNSTLIEFISKLWASNDSVDAQNVTQQIVNKVLPPNVQWSLLIDNQNVYNTSGGIRESNIISKRVVSGFRKGNLSAGYVASAFLTNIGGKSAFSYYFFGGFVGQGVISFNISDIPYDANFTSIYMEMNAGTNFTLMVNGTNCGTFNKTVTGIAADNWTIKSSCLNSIQRGLNTTFLINFAGSDNSRQYIGGGFIRIAYTTQQLTTSSNITRYYLPGIAGAINYYDSFYIPGNLSNLSIHLEFNSSAPLAMLINNVTVYNFTGNVTNQTVDIVDSSLKTILNYSQLGKNNNLLRIGSLQIIQINVTINATVDAILATSDAGTMGNCDVRNGSLTSCGSNGNVTRLTAAQSADIVFSTAMLNISNNRVGSLSYHVDINNPDTQELTSDIATIVSKINGIGSQGQSHPCYACALDQARRRLIPNDTGTLALTNALHALPPTGPGSAYNRTRIIVMMADGDVDRCDANDDAVDNATENFKSNCPGTAPKDQAIRQACLMNNTAPYAVNGTKIVIYTIGFGLPGQFDNSTLIAMANCTGGKYYQSDNFTELINIYKSIGQQTINITYTQQIVNGTAIGNSTLYRNSYVDFSYVKENQSAGYQQIKIDQETNAFGSCSGTFFVPSQLNVTSAKVTSYSSSFWTGLVIFNHTSTPVFNLSVFTGNITQLGDPFRIDIQPQFILTNKTSNISVLLTDNLSSLSANCSTSNKAIYSAGLRASVPFGSIFNNLSGGIVTIYYDIDHDGVADGSTNISIGSNLPNFNLTPRNVTQLDPTNNALDDALIRLLDVLNFVPGNGTSGSSSNPIDIALSNIDISSAGTSGVPFPWGPLDIKLSVGV